MKTIQKISFLIFLAFFISSCWVGPKSARKKMNKELNKVYAGMSIKDFRNEIPDAMLAEMKESVSVYSLMKTYMQVGNTTNFPIYKFFYFKDGVLVKIDEGKRATDYKIELEKTIKLIE